MKKKLHKNEKNLQYFPIPDYIHNEISTKGFYLYDWIDASEIKASVERDFLKFLNSWGTVIGIIFTILGGFFYISGTLSNIIILLIVVNLIFLFFVGFLSIYRSHKARENAFIVLTNSHFSVNKEIFPIKNGSVYGNKKVQKLAQLFEEDIFRESHIKKSKQGFFSQISEKVSYWFHQIFKLGKGNRRDTGKLVIIVLVLYIVFLLILAFMYIVGIFITLIFGLILSFINRQITLLSGHKILAINDGFTAIDIASEKLHSQKTILLHQLKQAQDNDWKKGLLTKIETELSHISKTANKAIIANTQLKKDIKDSKYVDMFDFHLYNSWLKSEVKEPLSEIITLLEVNYDLLTQTRDNIETQIQNSGDKTGKGHMELAKKRIDMQIESLLKNLVNMRVIHSKI